jgi:hypothetical protein
MRNKRGKRNSARENSESGHTGITRPSEQERYVSESSAEAVVDAAASVALASATGAGAGWRRATGIAGAAIGVIAAGAAAGVAVERLTVGRGMRQKARLALD